MLDYKTIIIKRYALHLSGTQIAKDLGCSKSGVNDFLKRFEECQILSFPLPDGITNYGIAELVYGRVSGQGTRNEAFVLPDYAEIHQKMTSRKNMTLIYQWNRYKKKCEKDDLKYYSYRQFCERYGMWCNDNEEDAHPLTTDDADVYIHNPPRVLKEYLEDQHKRSLIELDVVSEEHEIKRDSDMFVDKIKEISSHIFGQQMAIEEISKSLWYLTTVKRLSASSIGKVVDVLNAAYDWAVRRGNLEINPVYSIKPELKKKINRLNQKRADDADVDALEDDEVKLLVQEALKVNRKGEQIYPAGKYCLLLLYTGMRVGEMIALRWKDWDGKSLVIDKSISMAKNRDKKDQEENNYISIEGETKNQKARIIELTDDAKMILKEIKESRASAEPDEFIAVTKTGNINTASNLEHRLRAILKNAGLSDIKGGLHILRKTFATTMYENGARVEQIAAYIGDLESTTRKYYIAIRKKAVSRGKVAKIVKLPKVIELESDVA